MKKNFLKIAVGVALIFSATSCSVMNNARTMSALSQGVQAMTLSNAQVQEYVSQAVVQLDQQSQIAPANNAYTQRLNRLTKGITSVDGTPLNFKVYLTKEINAFACADGSVRVYSGLMDSMTDDEVMGIIGHEIGHVGKEHSKNAMKQELLNSAILNAAGSMSTTVAKITDSQLIELGKSFMSARYSRKQETEADDYAYDFLKASGKNPYNMVLAFEKIKSLETSGTQQSAASYFAKMFSTHPETDDRIAHIQQRCAQDGYKRPANK